MNEIQRRNYESMLRFLSTEEIELRLREVESAIRQKLSKKSGVGDWYFERAALKNNLEGRRKQNGVRPPPCS
jgi:hypothetical protein